MTIAIGDQIPEVKVFTFGDKGPEATTSTEVLGQGNRGQVVTSQAP